MGKRKKVQYETCGNIFNVDFQKQYEKALHGGKRIKVKVLGAPENPFVPSVRFKKEQFQIIPAVLKKVSKLY